VVEGEAPPDFDAGRKWCLEGVFEQTDVSSEGCDARYFDCPRSVAASLELGEDALADEVIRLLAREHAWVVLHDAGVRVHGRERLEIGVAPLPEEKSGRV
jgi:hypothetical protein